MLGRLDFDLGNVDGALLPGALAIALLVAAPGVHHPAALSTFLHDVKTGVGPVWSPGSLATVNGLGIGTEFRGRNICCVGDNQPSDRESQEEGGEYTLCMT